MNNKKLNCLLPIVGLVLALTPVLEASAQNKTEYYKSVASSCQKTLQSNGRGALWLDIEAAAATDAGNTSSDTFYKREAEHCEWNLRSEKPLWQQIRFNAISTLPIPNQDYYEKRLAEHCESLLNNTNRRDWWRLIRKAALNDAEGKINSPHYYKRAGEHCAYVLRERKRPEDWHLIAKSARLDAFNQ